MEVGSNHSGGNGGSSNGRRCGGGGAGGYTGNGGNGGLSDSTSVTAVVAPVVTVALIPVLAVVVWVYLVRVHPARQAPHWMPSVKAVLVVKMVMRKHPSQVNIAVVMAASLVVGAVTLAIPVVVTGGPAVSALSGVLDVASQQMQPRGSYSP